MYTIDTEITIEAPPATVWQILTDLPAYREWNPFIVRAVGEATVGTVLELDFAPPGGKVSTARPTVLTADPERLLRWRGTAGPAMFFAATHELALEPAGPAGTLVRHREEFTGLLVPLLKGTLKRAEEGFRQMNRALKERAEKVR